MMAEENEELIEEIRKKSINRYITMGISK